MDSIAQLRQAVLGHLRTSGYFREVSLLEAFPAAQRDTPPAKPVVTVGVASVELGGMGGYCGTDSGQALYGAPGRIALALDIFVPRRDGASVAARLFEALCDVLLLTANPFHIVRLACEAVVFDAEIGALRLPVCAELYAALTVPDETAEIERIVLQTQ